MPACESGCLCATCTAEARAFAYGHWNLHEFDDYSAVVAYQQEWRALEDGSARVAHKQAA